MVNHSEMRKFWINSHFFNIFQIWALISRDFVCSFWSILCPLDPDPHTFADPDSKAKMLLIQRICILSTGPNSRFTRPQLHIWVSVSTNIICVLCLRSNKFLNSSSITVLCKEILSPIPYIYKTLIPLHSTMPDLINTLHL